VHVPETASGNYPEASPPKSSGMPTTVNVTDYWLSAKIVGLHLSHVKQMFGIHEVTKLYCTQSLGAGANAELPVAVR